VYTLHKVEKPIAELQELPATIADLTSQISQFRADVGAFES
jgi:hypothetical protein